MPLSSDKKNQQKLASKTLRSDYVVQNNLVNVKEAYAGDAGVRKRDN